MILSALSQSDRYAALHPLFPYAFEFIRNSGSAQSYYYKLIAAVLYQERFV